MVVLESVVFYSQNKSSHQLNDMICCQRVNCSFWVQNKFTGSHFFLNKSRKYNKRHKSTREQHIVSCLFLALAKAIRVDIFFAFSSRASFSRKASTKPLLLVIFNPSKSFVNEVNVYSAVAL